jgi:serine/threonine protein kinase
MKVFVGSTYQDLLAYRVAASRAILMAGGLSEDMLYWPATDSPPLDESLRHLRSSDLMILLLAHRYGTPPSGLQHSITELEFDEALSINVPILAFQVDPDYAWPPRFIESDWEVRACLERFAARVRSKVTVGAFTTPDSLEVAITHAVMHHSGRRMSVAIPEYAVKRLHHVNRAESLFYSPESTVRIGGAPDGAPLLLAVSRRILVTEPMARIAEMIGKEPDDPFFSEMMSQVNQEARNYAAARGVYSSRWNGRALNIFMPHRKIVELMSPTLFQSMLGAKRQDSSSEPSFHSENTSVAGLDSSEVRHQEVASLGGGNRYLCIALDGDQSIWTGGWSSSEPEMFIMSRQFIEEGLERLAGVRYVIRRKKDQHGYVWARGDEFTTVIDTEVQHRFHESWVDLLTSAGDDELARHVYEMRIPRISIIKFVLEVIEEVGDLHNSGRIHGDIKPSNTLVSRNGKALIDDVGLTVGEISPTVTVSWSPFEQLLRQPLSCAADVFPLGQMLLHVLGGQLLGREVSYRMPEGKRGVIVEDPAIYMAVNGCIPSFAIRKDWCRFIEKALKTDPGQRWQSAGAMAAELRALVDRNGIEGHVSINLPWDKRPSLVHSGNGEIGMGWVMRYDEIAHAW